MRRGGSPHRPGEAKSVSPRAPSFFKTWGVGVGGEFKHFFNCFLFRHSLASLGRGPTGRPKQPREEASSPGDGHQDQVGGRDRQLERDRPLLLRSPGIPRLPLTPPNTAVCRGKNTFTKKTAFGTLSPAGYHCRCEARASEEQSLATVPHCAHSQLVGCRFLCFPRQMAEKGMRVAICFPPVPGRDVKEIKVSLKSAVEAKSILSIDNSVCI